MRRFFVLLVLVFAAGCASNGSSRDALLRIVTDCLDTGAPRYCARCPSPQAGTCDLQYPCTRTTEVWAETEEYIAIRDLKMCGCPAGFVHGLAMPRYPVRGPEDPRRPEALWRFAWDVARSRISDEREIALLINPPALRTQDQLHIHLVRLLPDARARIDALKPDAIADFNEGVKKVTAGVTKVGGGSPQTWYSLASGGNGPAVVLVQERKSMSEMAGSGKSLEQMMQEAYGDQGAAILAGLRKGYYSSRSELLHYRADLSYMAPKK